MIRLTHLTVDGLKAAKDVSLRIPRLLALTGPNGSGKTSILQAIRVGVLGYEPTVGKRLEATRQLASADEISVGLTFEGGFGISRVLGKRTSTEVMPPEGEKTEEHAQERINGVTGSFLPSFDLGAYLALSSEKRRAELFKMLPRELARLNKELWRERLGYEAAEPVVRNTLDELWTDTVLQSSSWVEGLSTALEMIRVRFNAADHQRQDQVKEAGKALKQAERGEPAAPTALISGEQLAGLQKRLTAAEQDYAALRARENAAEKQRRRATEREERLARGARMIADVDAQLEVKRAALAEAEAAGEPDAAAVAAAQAEVARLEGDIGALQADARTEREAAASAAGVATGKERAARAERDKRASELAEVQDGDRCPLCGAEAEFEHVKAHRAEQLAEAETVLGAAEADARAAMLAMDAAGKESDHRAFALGDQLSGARESLHAKLSAARAAEHLVRLRGEIDGLERTRAGHVELRDSIAAEQMEAPEAVPADELRAAFDAATKLRAEVESAQRQLGEAERARGRVDERRARADREQEQLDRITWKANALKQMLGSLQALRAQVIQGMVEPVEATANEVLQTIDPAKSFRFQFETKDGKDTFDFGFVEDGTFRGYDTASTGEDAFLAVVFVAALIAAVQPGWPVLMVDDVQDVDAQRLKQLMLALAKLEDRIGNVIIASCYQVPAVEGWTVLRAEGGCYTPESGAGPALAAA